MPVGIKIEQREDGYYLGKRRIATSLGPVDPKLCLPPSVQVRACPVCGMVSLTDQKIFPAACVAVAETRRFVRLDQREQVERVCKWCRRPFVGPKAQRMCSDLCRHEARLYAWREASEKRVALGRELRAGVFGFGCRCRHCRRPIIDAKRMPRVYCSERCRSAARRKAPQGARGR